MTNTKKKISEPKTFWVKKVTISARSTSSDKVSYVHGTLEYLQSYFGYTLEIGHSHNPKIKTQPATIKSFVSNLQKSYTVKEGSCYTRTYVELVDGPSVMKIDTTDFVA